MDYKNFDNKLKNALEGLEAPFDPSAWAAFEQRLNAPFTEEQPAAVDAVDKAVFRTLERLDAPYQPAHWDMLATRMTQVARTRRRIWIAKLTEAAIFLLLLANLEGFLRPASAPSAPAPAAPGIKSNRLQAEAPARRDKRGAEGMGSDALADNAEGAFPSSGTDVLFFGSDAGIDGSQAASPALAEGFSTENTIAPGQSADALAVSEAWIPLADLMPVPLVLPAGSVERVNASPYAASTVKVKAPKQHRMYAATFAFEGGLWTELQASVLVAPEQLLPFSSHGVSHSEPWVLAGNVFGVYGERVAVLAAQGATALRVVALPTASAMLRLAPQLIAAGKAVAAENALPSYIRDKVAKTTSERAAEKAAVTPGAAT